MKEVIELDSDTLRRRLRLTNNRVKDSLDVDVKTFNNVSIAANTCYDYVDNQDENPTAFCLKALSDLLEKTTSETARSIILEIWPELKAKINKPAA